MTDQTPPPITEEEQAKWVREQFQRANQHLAENGVLFDSVVIEESRYLAPSLAIWKIKATDGKYYWVISGEVPVDFTLYENAKDARGLLTYFALKWQMKAENLRQASANDPSQVNFAAFLQGKAESLYQIKERDELWREE
ncbi:DUF4826 family protein [Alteromonas sp. ASW11-130]|uniref:DUF4826 family protein n=1 Tax=Alteromonas sp. ASW11-130 TaxID=3015775 RepID=UPI002241ADF5|nr:DUF4826 family protein [Alteromonas sp. ASW11-130]MCW8090214.1 DUF4826 family protein [Alteromonas sp. ASW11-130]